MAGTNILVRQKDLIAGSGISITPDTTSGNVTIAATNAAIDESRLLPETGSVSSDSVGNPVIFKAISRIDNTYWLCLPLNEDTNDRSTYDVATRVYGTVNIVSNAPSSPGGSAFFNGSSCLHGTLPAQFGSGDFTVRFWMMAPTISSSSSSQTIFSTRRGNQTDADTFGLLCTTEGRLFIYSNGDITSRTDTPFTLQPSVWYHVAVVRKSGVLTIYVNGEVYNSATFTNSLTRQIFGLGASWTGSSYSEAGTVYLTSLDVLNYAAYDGAFTTPAYQPGILAGMGYAVATDSEVTDMLSAAGIDESRLIPTGGRNGNLLEYQEGVDRGNDVNTKLLIQPATSDGQIIDSAYGNEAPVGISQGTSNSPVTVENGESLAFSGSSAYLTIAKEDAAKIITGTNEWCFDVLITPEWSSGSAGAFHLGGGNYSIYINPSTGNSWIWSLSESGTIGLFANETHLLTLEQWLDGSTWKLSWYCDGVPKRTESFQYPVPDKAIRIGRGNDNDGYFQGKMNNIRFRTVADHRGASFAMPPFPFLPPAGQPVWAEGIDRSRLLKVPISADEGKLPVIRADKIPAVYHDTTLAAIVIEGDKVIDKISGKELTKVGSPQIINGGIHSPTNSDYYMLELEGVEGLPVAVSFDYQGDESPDSSNIVVINEVCAYYSMNGRSFCRSQGGGNNIKIDDQPVGVSEAYRNYVMQVSSDNYESKTPPVAFIAGETKSPTYEGSFPAISPLSSVRICGRFGKIKNILIGSVLPYTGNFTPRGDGVEGFGIPEKQEPGWNYETLDEAANGRLLPANPANGDIPCFDATATVGGGNDAHTKILLHFDADEIKDEAAGNAAPVTITKKSGTITVVEGGKWGKCAKFVTGSMTVATNLDELNANNWVVSGWFNPDENNHGVSYPTWLSMDDQNTHGFGFDSTGRYGESDGPLFYLDTPPASGTWHWLAIVKYSGGLRFYLNGAFLNEISAQQLANFCSTLAIGGFAGTYAAGSTERTFSGLVDEVRLQYIPDDEITQWTGTSIAVPDAPYSKPQTVGEWGKLNKSALVRSVNNQTPDSSGAVTIPVATASAAGLMAAADKAAIAGLTAQGIYPNVAIATAGSGIDYNLFKTQGTFYIPYYTVVSNGPVSAGSGGTYPGGFLSVLQANLSGGISVQQIFHLHANNKAYIRSYNGDTDTWSAWNRVIVDTDLATTTVAGLMSATDREKSIGLTTRGFYPNALAKSGAVDFNEVIDHGFYFIGGDTPHLNYPETYQQNGGTLQVIRNGNYLTQTFIPLNINTVFIRTCVNALSDSSARTFSAWRRALTNTEITESKALPGYFKLPGGTIVQWGNFEVTADPQTQEITLPVALSSVYVRQASGSNSALRIGIYGGPGGKITCYVDGKTSGTVGWMVIGK